MNKKKYLVPSMEVMKVDAASMLASSVGITNTTTDLDAILSREVAALNADLEKYLREVL